MFVPESKKEYEKILIQNFEKKKVLIFLSNSIEISKEFENTLFEIEEEFEENKAIIILIKEEKKEINYLFKTYDVKFVPSIIILNSDISIYKKFSNISPAELLLKIEDFDHIFNTNFNLEKEKYKNIFKKYLVPNQIIFLNFGNRIDKNIEEKIKNLEVTYKEINSDIIKEDNFVTINCQLNYYLNNQYIFDLDAIPLFYLNQQVFVTFDELELFLNENKKIRENLKSNDRKEIERLVEKYPVFLFINKKNPDSQIQEKILEFLKKKNVIFGCSDYSEKKDVKDYLSEKTNEKNITFPIIKINEVFYTDLSLFDFDVVNQPINEDKKIYFLDVIPKDLIINSKDDFIKHLLTTNKIMVFIKGTPSDPHCGFSSQIIQYLNSKNVEYNSFNILSNSEVRERLKELYNWKTFPQLYIKGELIGGNDIIQQLESLGEMDILFQNAQLN